MSGCGYWDMVDCLVEEFDAQEVLPKLYIGSAQAAQCVNNLRDHNITHVLSISTNPPTYDENQFKCLSISIEDEEKKDLKSYFDQAHQFIEQGRALGGILIHCTAGVSRSATVVISYLMSFFFKPFLYCFQYLKSIRPCIQPNRGFISQLITYESIVLQKTTQQLQKQVSTTQKQLLCNNSCCNNNNDKNNDKNSNINNNNNNNNNNNGENININEQQKTNQNEQQKQQELSSTTNIDVCPYENQENIKVN